MVLLCAALAAKANQLANFPLNFLRIGYYGYSDGKIYARTTHGDWWSSTGSSIPRADYLSTKATGVAPQDSSLRGYGLALRCVARQRALFDF